MKYPCETLYITLFAFTFARWPFYWLFPGQVRCIRSGDHTNVAMALHRLGVLAANTSRPAQVHAYFERALAIFQASLHPDDPKVTDCMATLASL